MPCELHDEAWLAMLEARRLLEAGERELVFAQRNGEWRCLAAGAAEGSGATQVLTNAPRLPPQPGMAWTIYHANATGTARLEHPTDRPVHESMQAYARVYLPVLLGAAAARDAQHVFVAAHITQTLDGRIACANGQSQWIGNESDQHHAHRMRALLDGVLVGAGTVLSDNPRLTVRHVEGRNPRRIVLTGNGRALRAGPQQHVFDAPGTLAIVRGDVVRGDVGSVVSAATRHVEVVTVDRNGTEALAPGAILAALAQRGIHSIYLEGGATTLSSFLQGDAIDLLQVHIAPMVLGSGLSGFNLPMVESVRDGRPMIMDHASLDGHLLLTCWPQGKPASET